MIGVGTSMCDPNSFASTVVYAMPIAISIWSLVDRKWWKGGILGYLALSGLCVLKTGSRGHLWA